MENKLNLVDVQKRVAFLKDENAELKTKTENNRTEFSNWINENYKSKGYEISYDGSYVEISDKKFHFEYTIESGVLKLNKKLKSREFERRFGGFMHPMEMMYFMMEKMENKEFETIYEGNESPVNNEELYLKLKEDMINKGEISRTIKKYIYEDRKMRTDANEKMENNSREIRKLESEYKTALENQLKEEFSKEKLVELFKNKTTLINGEKYNFLPYQSETPKSITFKKETDDKYYLELLFSDDNEETLKLNKKDFKISKYLTF